MDAFVVDLTNCDLEPIHIIGKIQAHGLLIGVNSKSHLVSYMSENACFFIDDEAVNFLGKHIDELEAVMKISNNVMRPKLSHLLSLGAANGFESNNPFITELDKKPYNLILNNSDDIILLEFEPCNATEDFNVQKTIGLAISKILAQQGLQDMLQTAAHQIKNIIQYDRVMIYQFAADGHGEVVAEDKNENLEPFYGLHYPASDIPQQARALYKINLTRLIADVNTTCPDIITYTKNDTSLDLTHAVLRAVSPIHIQYLKNMGVCSSFSISLISHGELWGLVACHNYTPKFIDYKARDASKLIGQILSPALEYRLGEEDSEKFALINQTVNTLIKYAEKETDIIQALTGKSLTINDICATTGSVLLFDDTVTRLGLTPDDEQIKELANWILKNTKEMIFFTDGLPALFLPAKEYCEVASGVFACIISKELGEMILFFKPEQKHTVNWAGNPEKAVTAAGDGSMQLSPRQSFASWLQIVHQTSEAWTRAETAALMNLREEIIYQISRKANETRKLNDKLKLAYEELDNFNFTVSHDLQTPLTTIKGYTQVLLHTVKNLDDYTIDLLKKITAGTDRMALLIKEILRYSNYTRHYIIVNKVDMKQLIEDIDTETKSWQPINLQFLTGNTPNIYGDATMIKQLFTNLIGNAIKYSSKKDNPVIKVDGYVLDDKTIYSISDNGIGIDKNYHIEIFDLFKRAGNVKDFEGTGVGLAIVKRIVEKHEGKIWLESEPGKGTVFYFSLNNELTS